MAQREYVFSCDDCAYEFSKVMDWNKIQSYKAKCPNCDSKKVYREFGRENVIIDDSSPKTVGALADKNAKLKGIK